MSQGRTDTASGGRLSHFLDSPVIGMSPWIAMSVLVGPGRFELAVAIALALAVAIVIVGRIRRPGSSFKILEIADVVFFAVMAIIGIFASPGTHSWLENYLGSREHRPDDDRPRVHGVPGAVHPPVRPGTGAPRVLGRAQISADQLLHHGCVGRRIRRGGDSGAYGDLVLHNSNNPWTGWIIQIAAIIAALQFTQWYPDVVRARSLREQNLPGPPEPPLSSLLIPLAGYLTPVGIVVLVSGAGPVWLGVALIVLGIVLVKSLSREKEAEPEMSR